MFNKVFICYLCPAREEREFMKSYRLFSFPDLLCLEPLNAAQSGTAGILSNPLPY